ncbi:MAG TPA: Holliday junction resolvase RuvX [Phycisphaerae bacterium]|nr:Holliday junction resolvase RuvX [Phycisphaerae bacterium]
MSKILGIDYGGKRIGVAVADTQTRIAMPLTVVAGRNDVTRDARNVADLGERECAEGFVVGLPLNMSDEGASDSEQTTLTRRFAAELERLSNKPVHLQDERLTSHAAQEVLQEAAVSPKKRKGLTDMIAAQKILQAWLDRT